MFGHQRLLRLPAAAAIAAACCVLPVAACSNGDETATATATVAASTPVATPTSVPGPTATTVPATPTRTPAPAATPTQTSGPQESLEELAVRLVTMMSEQRFSEVVAHFDATMSQVMPVSVTGQAWSQIQAQVGTFQRVERTQVTPAGQYMVVTVTTVFSGLPINIEITFDASRKVAGLFFKPADEYAAPSYANETVFTETEVVVGSAPWKLPGTLTMPNGDGPFPAVVLVHGSGPNNRDETVGPNKPFKDLAWGLATRGIAVLRYDKRTAVYPGELAAIAQSLTIREETVIDARAAADLLMGTAKIDPNRIFVAGHSLGGMLAPMIAAEHDGIAGLVILAGAARPLEEIILQQTRYLAAIDGTVDAQEQSQIDAVEALVAKVLAMEFAEGELVLGGARAYWESLTAYNPTQAAAALTIPMLVMQGGRDYQVTLEDFALWKAALEGRANVEFREYASLNHLFIPGVGTPSPQEYGTHGSVFEGAVNDISEWIRRQ